MRTSAFVLVFTFVAGQPLTANRLFAAQERKRPLTTRTYDGPPAQRAVQAPGTVVVPRLAGQQADAAGPLLGRAGLAPGRVLTRASDRAKGTILDQKPPAGTRVAPGTRVDILVSSGSERSQEQSPDDVAPVETLIPVPNLTGSAIEIAPRVLERRRLEPGRAIPRPSNRPRGTILDQRPAAGARVRAGTRVDVIVSAGPPPPLAPERPIVADEPPAPPQDSLPPVVPPDLPPPLQVEPPAPPPAPAPVEPVAPLVPIAPTAPVAIVPAPQVAAPPLAPVPPITRAAPPVAARPVEQGGPVEPAAPVTPVPPVTPIVPATPATPLGAETPADDPPAPWTMPLWPFVGSVAAALLYGARRLLRRARRGTGERRAEPASRFVFAPRIDPGRQAIVPGGDPVATLELAMHIDPGIQQVIHAAAPADLEDSHERARSDAERSLRVERRHRRAS